jgi:Bacterial extracellular solute-binding proteins, family 5 Middle
MVRAVGSDVRLRIHRSELRAASDPRAAGRDGAKERRGRRTAPCRRRDAVTLGSCGGPDCRGIRNVTTKLTPLPLAPGRYDVLMMTPHCRSFRLCIAVCVVVACVSRCATPPQDQLRTDESLDPFYETLYLLVNVKQRPFDDVRVRYALAMATDRGLISRVVREGNQRYVPARGLVPPYAGYESLEQLELSIEGHTYDVLAYDPAGARQLLASAGYSNGKSVDGSTLTVEILVYADGETDRLTTGLKELWKDNLGVDVRTKSEPWHDYMASLDRFDFEGVAIAGRSTLMGEAGTLLFSPLFQLEKIGWSDHEVLAVLDTIGSVPDSKERARLLQQTEARLLTRMPVIPLFSRTP